MGSPYFFRIWASRPTNELWGGATIQAIGPAPTANKLGWDWTAAGGGTFLIADANVAIPGRIAVLIGDM